jgi:hypothetical protein
MGLASFSELLLPLLGGFLFVMIFRPLRFLSASDTGQRLLLLSASFGILLAIIGHGLGSLVIAFSPSWGAPVWNTVSPFPAGGFLALLTGPALAGLLNLIPTFGEAASHQLAHRVLRNKLALLFSEALAKRKPVMLTLYSGKVYVGFPKESVSSISPSAYMNLLPILSGYREPIEGEGCRDPQGNPTQIYFNTFYQELTETLLKWKDLASSEGGHLEENRILEIELENGTILQFDPSDIGITIPIDQIEVATIFSKPIYEYFNPSTS